MIISFYLEVTMEVIREIRKVNSDKVIIDVPAEYRDRDVEIIISPMTKKEIFSKEIENFLKLGGSGCWEGNLDKMRESRNGSG
jgi:hypothetical protein